MKECAKERKTFSKLQGQGATIFLFHGQMSHKAVGSSMVHHLWHC